jgi:cytochrome oxidase Cu insertion factor (SCO1/SenC/PrrC family)
MMRDLMSGTAAVGGPFTLTDVDGRRRSLADFRGKVVILYFGYTFCPDVCPTDLASIAQLMQVLGPDSAKVQPLFVTLDPQRDTSEVLREYAAAFDSRLVALRGSETEVRRVATSYKLYFRKVYPQKSNTYFIEHASLTYLLDQEGHYVAFFPPGTTGKRMAVLVRERL